MTPAEREELRDLTNRLFGMDGQGGAIGAINAQLSTLLNDKQTRDVARAQNEVMTIERRRIDDRREAVRLALASVIGGGIMAVIAPVVLHLMGLRL